MIIPQRYLVLLVAVFLSTSVLAAPVPTGNGNQGQGSRSRSSSPHPGRRTPRVDPEAPPMPSLSRAPTVAGSTAKAAQRNSILGQPVPAGDSHVPPVPAIPAQYAPKPATPPPPPPVAAPPPADKGKEPERPSLRKKTSQTLKKAASKVGLRSETPPPLPDKLVIDQRQSVLIESHPRGGSSSNVPVGGTPFDDNYSVHVSGGVPKDKKEKK